MAGTIKQRYDLFQANTAFVNPLLAVYAPYDAATAALLTKLARWQAYDDTTKTALGALDLADYTNIKGKMDVTAGKYATFKTRATQVYDEFSQRMQLALCYKDKLAKLGEPAAPQADYNGLVSIYGSTVQSRFTTLTPKLVDLNTKFDTLDAALIAHPVTSTPPVPPATTPTVTVHPDVTAAATAVNAVITSDATAIALLGTQLDGHVAFEAPYVPKMLKVISDGYLAQTTPAWNTDVNIKPLLQQVSTPALKALL